jgi:hypothetical protein
MKSIGEWMEEKAMGESFTRAALQNTMGGGTIDPVMKLKLRSKILEIAKEFPEMNQTQLFQSIMSVVGQLLTHGSGGKVAVGSLYNKLNNGAPKGQPNDAEVK